MALSLYFFPLPQENAAVMRVIPLILSINTSVFVVTGVETKGKINPLNSEKTHLNLNDLTAGFAGPTPGCISAKY